MSMDLDAGPFPPTPAAAQARLAAVDPDAYAATRNAIDGAVTRLSPYVSRGFLTLPEVHDAVQARRPMPRAHKFIQELGWREYFHHVWRHRGDGILESLHPGPMPDAHYRAELPEDLLAGRTGVRAIDRCVEQLCAEGWLHNHARLWLAGWLVHERQVHWRTGADWMYGHLIDGDLASNHLSWQWVSGTGSHKPYRFSDGNVARLAPPAWQGRYDPARASRFEPPAAAAVPLQSRPPEDLGFAAPPAPGLLAGRRVWLAHPGALDGPPPGFDGVTVALLPADDLTLRPWSERRWRFVGSRLRILAPDPALRWIGSGNALASALSDARVDGRDDPHLPRALRRLPLRPVPRLFDDPPERCDSFSRFWARVGPAPRLDERAAGRPSASGPPRSGGPR